MTHPSCMSCRFFQATGDPTTPTRERGCCRRFPPVSSFPLGNDRQPTVYAYEWCGEYQRRDK